MNQYVMFILPCLGLCLLSFFFLTKRLGAKTAIIIVAGVVLAVTLLVSVRDHIVSYSSPEEAFISTQGTPDEACEVIMGEETALVIGQVNGTLRCVVVDKIGDRWKNGNILSFEHPSIYLSDGCLATPFYKKGVKDYYLMVSILSDEDHVVCDNKVGAYRKMGSPNVAQYYVSHMTEIADDYVISVDGIYYPIQLDNKDG